MNKKCQDVMTEKPVCCAPDETVQRAAQLMRQQNVGPIPVCDQSKRCVGIITDRDIAVKVVAEGRDPVRTPVSEIMTREVFSCRPADDVQAAIETMERQQVRRIPVVDDNGRVLGIISQADIATRLRAPDKTAEVVTEVSRPSTMRA